MKTFLRLFCLALLCTVAAKAQNAVAAGAVLAGQITPGSGGGGGVSSVGLTLPGIFNVTVSPITTSGSLTAVLNTQTANFVWAGPTTGSASAPTFRALVPADLPVATSGALGIVRGDGTTITNSGGVLTAAGGGSSGFPIVLGTTSIASGSTTTVFAGFTLTAPNFTGLSTSTVTPAANTVTDGMLLNNSVTASNANQSISGALDLEGQGWKSGSGGASQPVAWKIYTLPIQGVGSALADLNIDFYRNGALVGTELQLTNNGGMTLANGSLNAVGLISSGGNIFAGSGSNTGSLFFNDVADSESPSLQMESSGVSSNLMISIPASELLTVNGTSVLNQDVSTAGAPSFNGATITANLTTQGATVTTANPMSALAINVAKGLNTKSVSGPSTFTFSGTPGSSNTWWALALTDTGSAGYDTITLPSVINGGATITTYQMPSPGKVYLTFTYDGTNTYVFGIPIFSGEQTVTFGSTSTLTMTPGQQLQNAVETLTGNTTLAFSGLGAGMYGQYRFIQDATGSRTLTLPANSKVVNGGAGAITLSTAANAVDILSWYSPNGTLIEWSPGKNFN